MSMLAFYITRVGRKPSKVERKCLDAAKDVLRVLYGGEKKLKSERSQKAGADKSVDGPVNITLALNATLNVFDCN